MTSNESATNSIEVAAVLGRIEANIFNLTGLTKENTVQMKEIDTRLRAVETAVAQKPDDERFRVLERKVENIEATRPVKVPWWTIVAGLASVVAIVAGVLALLNLNLVAG